MYWSEGCRAWSKAMGLGSILEGVQVFESPPSHSIRFPVCQFWKDYILTS